MVFQIFPPPYIYGLINYHQLLHCFCLSIFWHKRQYRSGGQLATTLVATISAIIFMVDYHLLLQKLQLFGLDREAVAWMSSYLIGRRQSVLVDGSLSSPLGINCGVPQGSILGPLMYILYTNDIPDLPHNHPVSAADPVPYCQECGATVHCCPL